MRSAIVALKNVYGQVTKNYSKLLKKNNKNKKRKRKRKKCRSNIIKIR